jgi:hypothetical protein
MAERWNLIRVHPGMLISFGYPSREHALLAALDLCDDVGDDCAFHVEGPSGQRIEQREIVIMRFIPKEMIAKRA